MVRPVEDNVVTGTIQTLHRIPLELGYAERAEGQVGERGLQLGADVTARGDVIRVPENLDVLVKRLQVLFGVLRHCQSGKLVQCQSRIHLTLELTGRRAC